MEEFLNRMRIAIMRDKYFKVGCLGFLSLFSYMMLIPSLTDVFLAHLGVPQLSSFILSDGDKVNCIPFRNLYPTAAWRSGPVSKPLGRIPRAHFFNESTSDIKQAEQVLSVEDGTCNIGQVPVRKATGEPNLQIIPGGKAHLKNENVSSSTNYPETSITFWPEDRNAHKYAVASIKGPYTGTEGRLNIWQPHVEDGEFSLAQVWVASVDKHGVRHSIEAGWQIYKEVYGDRRPRLFTFWTADNYNKSGCYNMDCIGFVQTSNKVLLGGSFAAVSSVNSTQYEFKLGIFLDNDTGDWWLQLNDEYVGYWPKVLFGSGSFNFTSSSGKGDSRGTRIDWGGEVWHQRGHYTATQMGSGQYPSSSAGLYRRAAYVRNMQVTINHEKRLVHLPKPHLISSFPDCCHIVVEGPHRRNYNISSCGSSWGTHIFFGGPGFNKHCSQKRGEEFPRYEDWSSELR